MELFKCQGTIVYNPDRGKANKRQTENTIVVEIDDGEDLAAYYRTLFEKKFGIFLHKPNYAIHMTINKERELTANPWGYLNGKKVELTVTDIIRWTQKFVWIDVKCPEFYDILNHYNLTKKSGSHITIGKFKPYDIGTPIVVDKLNRYMLENPF